MLTPEQRDTARRYLEAKSAWSTWNDGFMQGAPRARVPAFATIAAAVQYYVVEHGNPWTGDPLWGAGDFYLHPRRLQGYLFDKPLFGRPPIDCDDVQGWYWHAVVNVPGVTDLKTVSLVDPTWSLSNRSHVILVGHEHGKAFALDVNGYTPLPDLTEATLCGVFSEKFLDHGITYAGALDTEYPFKP